MLLCMRLFLVVCDWAVSYVAVHATLSRAAVRFVLQECFWTALCLRGMVTW